ncbi:hypothetical protein [Paractinoplanes maris]|uniref:hypothetical protein n=1 Tax=Paractinoplanes maris TaxID=1734446 RepID=UPI00202164B6|nr:hypothetical protein [Actinoplanes maris]
MNSREHLSTDIDRIDRVTKRVGAGVWGVAAFVMIYGVFVSIDALTDHGVPGAVAWMPSLAADVAMSVAIGAGPILARYDISAGWIGFLRWFAAFATWALQTASSWLHPGGIDWAGVGLHSIPPALLFAVGEGAAYFVRKMSGVLEDKRRALAAAEQKDADVRAHRAETDAKLRAVTAELSAARAKNETLTERITAHDAAIDAERSTATLTVERLEAEIGSLRTALTAQAEKFTADRDEEIRNLKAKHAESLAKTRAEKKTVSLTDYRNKHAEKPSPQPSPQRSNKPAMSDEDAVQAMFTAHSNPDYDWPQNEVRTLTGVGFNARMDRLIATWRERAHREAGGDAAVNQ